MTLSPQFLDELRTRTLLSALVGRSVKLTRAGREFKACCPFHNEKTPSFWVNDEKAFYHCFGCGAHGDAIRFLTDAKGLPFMDAVKELAQAAGMDVPAPDPQSRERAERQAGLHDVVAAAQRLFADDLAGPRGADARAYLQRRGIAPALAGTFGFGFAADSRTRLKDALSPEFGIDPLIEAGLLIRPDDGKIPYDRFRGRLTIPIKDARGRVIAFGGRIIGEGEPKYLNSPETPLFDKGRTLFNLDRAAAASRKTGRVVVVEGYLDVVALASAGIEEAVAPLGTAVTEQQLELLWRLSDVPVLCFDGDAAGRKAAMRAGERALPLLKPGKSLDIVTLPPGQDPDDLVKAGGRAALDAALAGALPLDRALYVSHAAEIDASSAADRSGLRQALENAAANCTDKLVSTEIRRNLTGYFFEDFGWKHKERRTIGSAILNTGPRGQVDLMALYVRSALYGLSRFPFVAAPKLEDIGAIRIEHPQLMRWRDEIMNAVYTRPSLASDAVHEILDRSALSISQSIDLRSDRLFSFTFEPAQNDAARDQLQGLIDMLAQEHALDQEMERLTRAAMEDSGDDHYMTVEAARQRVREAKFALYERGFRLGSADEPD
jgi:DNA primase